MEDKVTCKYLEEVCTKKEKEKKSLTASHWMLYVVLGVYIIVALAGLAFTGICVSKESYETGAQGLITVASVIGACSCTVVGFYTNKAAKENEIKLSNEKYRMRLEIAKEIFAEYGTSLDDKSVDLLRKLMSDENITEIIPASSPPTATVTIPNVDVTNFIRQNDSEEGLG